MKGKNKILFNQQVMNNAIEVYLREHYLKSPDFNVYNVGFDKMNEMFEITIEESDPVEHEPYDNTREYQ